MSIKKGALKPLFLISVHSVTNPSKQKIVFAGLIIVQNLAQSVVFCGSHDRIVTKRTDESQEIIRASVSGSANMRCVYPACTDYIGCRGNSAGTTGQSKDHKQSKQNIFHSCSLSIFNSTLVHIHHKIKNDNHKKERCYYRSLTLLFVYFQKAVHAEYIFPCPSARSFS